MIMKQRYRVCTQSLETNVSPLSDGFLRDKRTVKKLFSQLQEITKKDCVLCYEDDKISSHVRSAYRNAKHCV